MVEDSVTVSAKLNALERISCVQDTKYKKNEKYKNFLHEVGRSWISEVQNRSESNSDELQMPSRVSGDFRIHKLEKVLVVGREKRSILHECKVRAAYKKRTESR